MGKKEKKSKTAEQKARVAAKQSKKAAQKDKKIKPNATKGVDDSDGEDVDLESVLEEYAKKVDSAHSSERVFDTLNSLSLSQLAWSSARDACVDAEDVDTLIIALKSSSGKRISCVHVTAFVFERCFISACKI